MVIYGGKGEMLNRVKTFCKNRKLTESYSRSLGRPPRGMSYEGVDCNPLTVTANYTVTS